MSPNRLNAGVSKGSVGGSGNPLLPLNPILIGEMGQGHRVRQGTDQQSLDKEARRNGQFG